MSGFSFSETSTKISVPLKHSPLLSHPPVSHSASHTEEWEYVCWCCVLVNCPTPALNHKLVQSGDCRILPDTPHSI